MGNLSDEATHFLALPTERSIAAISAAVCTVSSGVLAELAYAPEFFNSAGNFRVVVIAVGITFPVLMLMTAVQGFSSIYLLGTRRSDLHLLESTTTAAFYTSLIMIFAVLPRAYENCDVWRGAVCIMLITTVAIALIITCFLIKLLIRDREIVVPLWKKSQRMSLKEILEEYFSKVQAKRDPASPPKTFAVGRSNNPLSPLTSDRY